MLDAWILERSARVRHTLAQRLVRIGVSADALTLTGFGLGLAAAALIALDHPLWGLAILLLSRLLDGLDGEVARLTKTTNRGAFLDIVCDFLVYASVPLAFAVVDPATNALAASVLLFSFMGTGASFLAYAILAERRGLSNIRLPHKGFYYLGGLTEGTETLLIFSLMCLWPEHFAVLAFGFAALCVVTTALRMYAGWKQL